VESPPKIIDDKLSDDTLVSLEGEEPTHSSSSTSSKVNSTEETSESSVSLEHLETTEENNTKEEQILSEEELEELEKKRRRDKKANSMNYVTLTILSRLPWKIIPFVISVFIIVEALTVAEWTAQISMGLGKAIGYENNNANVAIASFLFCSLTSVSCNILNNQPMTILFTRVLQNQDQNFTLAEKPFKGAMFGLILGSNFGANLTIVGALAGIMWAEILKQKGYKLGFFKFAQLGFTLMPLVIGVSAGILATELILFP